jgi:CRP/FNR family cyclic AMP-dependent transcriptional regulator
MRSEQNGEALCRILQEDPELAQVIPAGQRAEAIAGCLAPVLHLPRGRWPDAPTSAEPAAIGMLVMKGLLLRRVGIDGRFGAELLGEGDLLRPWQQSGAEASIDRTIGWRVLSDARLAVLDRRVARRLAGFPDLTGALVGRALARSRNLVVTAAIVHQPHVDVRLHMLFWHLADRWGTMSPDGVRVPIRLTHAVLAELIGARRPTVTTALARLEQRGVLAHTDGVWQLRGGPPGELLQVELGGSSPTAPA